MKLFHAILCTLILNSAPAADSPPIPVNVQVWGDANFTNEMTSYVKRELRELKDVEIVPDDTTNCYKLLIGVRGYAVSTVILYQDNPTNAAKFYTTYLTYSNDLKVSARKAVANFDTDVLEPTRDSLNAVLKTNSIPSLK